MAGWFWRKGSVMKRLTWRLRRRLTALLLAGVLACAAALVGLLAGPAVPAVAAGGCTAQYIVNSDWGTGFSIAINITPQWPCHHLLDLEVRL
jgi:hypothetical protein